MSPLPNEWRTERLSIRDSHPVESPLLFSVMHSSNQLAQLDPRFKLPALADIRDLIEGRKTPQYDRRMFQIQTIRTEEANGAIAGFFHLLHDRPKGGMVWLSLLAVASPFQLRGYGSEFLEGLCAQFQSLGGYHALQIEVFKRHGAAMLFFKKRGFEFVAEETPETFILLRNLGAFAAPPSGIIPT